MLQQSSCVRAKHSPPHQHHLHDKCFWEIQSFNVCHSGVVTTKATETQLAASQTASLVIQLSGALHPAHRQPPLLAWAIRQLQRCFLADICKEVLAVLHLRRHSHWSQAAGSRRMTAHVHTNAGQKSQVPRNLTNRGDLKKLTVDLMPQ